MKVCAHVVLALLLLGSAACHALDDAIAAKLVEDQEKVRSYEGTYRERGVLARDPSSEVVNRIRFRAPSSVVVESVEPEDVRGDAFAYVGSEMWIYSRALNTGVHVKGIPWDSSAWRDGVRESVRFNRAHFGYREGESKDTIAGRVATLWNVTPREAGDLRVRSRWWLDQDFSLPLRVELERPEGGLLYRFSYDEVAFNKANATPLAFVPDEGATWIEWDLGATALSLEQAREIADFPLLEPRETVEGLERTRIVRARTGLFPMLASVHARGPFFATVAQQKDRGIASVLGRGVPVDLDGTTGRITFVGTTSFLSFVRDGVQVTVTSNLPVPELVRFAKAHRKP